MVLKHSFPKTQNLWYTKERFKINAYRSQKKQQNTSYISSRFPSPSHPNGHLSGCTVRCSPFLLWLVSMCGNGSGDGSGSGGSGNGRGGGNGSGVGVGMGMGVRVGMGE